MPWPAGRPLDPSQVRAPSSLRCLSVCSPRAARVSGGLWGRRSPLQRRLQQSPSPQKACLENIPAQEGLSRGRHNDGPAHTQIHSRRPLHTNTRVHAQSCTPQAPRAMPGRTQSPPWPRDSRRERPNSHRRQPSDPLPVPPPDTQTRPLRPPGPARRSPRPLRPGGLTWPSFGIR